MAQLRTFLALAPFLLAGPIAISVLGGFSTSGCEAYHNEAERLAYKKALDAEEAKLYPPTGVAGAGGMASTYTYIGAGYNPPDPTQCPNGQCRPDPGSRVVSADECKAAEEGLEFLPLPIWDFEDDRAIGYDDKDKDRLWDRSDLPDLDGDGRTDEGTGQFEERFALHGYTYGDDTTYNYYPFGWEPPSIPDPYGRCERKDNHVFHIAGGPFIEWGGGLGRSLRCMNTKNWSGTLAQDTIDAWRTAKGYNNPTSSFSENTSGAIYCHTGQSTGASAYITPACDTAESTSKIPGICPQRDRIYKASKGTTIEPPQDKALLGMAIDVSAWEGISFWARRGPNSQAGFRVLVGDKYTDDDISFMQYMIDPTAPRYCERMFECKCKNASRPCTAITEEEAKQINRSLNTAHTDLPPSDPAALANPPRSYWEDPNSYNLNPLKAGDKICWDRSVPNAIAIATRTQYCGETSCSHQSDSGKSLNVSRDPFIDDTTCQEYTFRGSIQTNVCYNPDSEIAGQKAPPEQSQVCGDHWMRSIDLTEDWAFYTVPFNTLLQQGWAKRTYMLDLTALTLARITWDRGYIDYYIDDVRFYRKKK